MPAQTPSIAGFAMRPMPAISPASISPARELAQAIAYAKKRGVQTFVALNTFMRAGNEDIWYRGAARAVKAGADALILADFGLMAHVAEHHPQQRIHVSVQASASNADAVNFLVDAFGAKRVVLPRT